MVCHIMGYFAISRKKKKDMLLHVCVTYMLLGEAERCLCSLVPFDFKECVLTNVFAEK